MFIQTESTPNPLTIKFLPGRVVMESGTIFFQNKSESVNSPLAEKVFLYVKGDSNTFKNPNGSDQPSKGRLGLEKIGHG